MDDGFLPSIDRLLEPQTREPELAIGFLVKMKPSVGVNWRLAKAYYILSKMPFFVMQERELLEAGLDAAEAAVELAPRSLVAAKSAAILSGALAESDCSFSTRIKMAEICLRHIDSACELMDELHPNGVCLHLRGRLRFTVAALPFLKKSMACKPFGPLPRFTLNEALDDLHAADEVSPSLANCYFLGRAYEAKGNLEKAKEQYSRVNNWPMDIVDLNKLKDDARWRHIYIGEKLSMLVAKATLDKNNSAK